ncbi:MAG: transporter [Nitrospiraceae bacterium]|jgi:hypothetical protein|nr:transporter [Nitrospiraceae bacterium]
MRASQWARILAGVMVLGLWGVDGQAAEKADQGPTSPEQKWQIGFTPNYSSGKFGTDTTSSFVYAPLSIRRLFRDGDVTVIVPFVSVTSNGTATLVGGQPTQTIPGTCLKESGTVIDTSKPECLAFLNRGGAANKKVTNSGLGDIILRGRYYVVEEKDYMPLIAVTGRMKLPTASASQGLGTGAFDYGAGLEISKMLGEKWIAFLDGGYNVIGDPEGINFQNQHWYDVGAGYYFTRDVLVSAYYEEYRAILRGFVNARDIFLAANYTASAAWRFSGGVTLGLSDGAPDFALTVGTSYRF